MRKSLFSLPLLAALSFPFYGFAATSTWTGEGGDNNWSNPGNWTPSPPNPGDSIIFDGASTPNPTVNMDVNFVPGPMTFQDAVSCQFTGTEALTVGDGSSCPEIFLNQSSATWLSGASLNVNGNLELGGSSGTIQFETLAGGQNLTIDSGITATFTDTTWPASKLFTINGTANMNGANALPNDNYTLGNGSEFNLNGNSLLIHQLNGGGTINLSSDSSSGTLNINGNSNYSGTIKDGGSQPGSINIPGFTTTLSGHNTYSGGTTVGFGTLAIASSSSLGRPNASSYLLTLNHGVLTPLQNMTFRANSGLGINIVNTGTIDLSQASLQISCPITGASPLQITGSNTLTITSLASYQGTTQISGGTLKLSGTGSLPLNGPLAVASGAAFDISELSAPGTSAIGPLTGSGNVTLGGNTLSINIGSTTTTFSGSLTSTGGGLTTSGSAVLTLSGTSSFPSGATVNIQSGTLQAGSSSGLPSSCDYTLSNTAILDLNGYPLAMNTLSGGGTINLSSNSAAGSLTTKGSYSGIIQDGGSQPGSVSVDALTLNLSGENTYSGGTTIGSATLQFSTSSNLGSPNGSVYFLTFNGSNATLQPQEEVILAPSPSLGIQLQSANPIIDTTFASMEISCPIIGSASLTKIGPNVLALTGVNTYSGPTTVSGGTLTIGIGGVGSLTNSDVTVASGATLSGTGTIIESVTVQSGGTISGGNSIGTINIGTLTLNSGANLTLEINSAGESTIYDVTNMANLAGNLAVTVDRGVYQKGTTYRFITTGVSGRAGTFETITSNTFGSTTLTGELNYGTDFVELVLFSPIYAIIPTGGLTGNAKAVADYLNSLSADPEIQPVLLTVGALPTNEAQEALDSISPARNAISSWTAQNTLFGVNQVAVNRMLQQRYMRWIETSQPAIAAIFEEEELPDFGDHLLASQLLPNKEKKEPYGKTQTMLKEESYYAVWEEGFGLFASQDAIQENPAYSSSTGCGLVGADFYNFKQGQMGAAIGYAQSSIKESGAGKGSIQYYLAGLYGTAYIEDGYVELGLWGSFNRFYNTRDIAYLGFSEAAHSHHNGGQLVPHIGGGYDFNFSWGAIEPFATFDAAALFQQDYSEHGAGVLDMRIKSSTSWLLRAEAGLNAYQIVHMASSYLIFRETLSYVNLAPFGIGKLASAALVGFPPGFTVTSFTDVQNMISPGFELFFKHRSGFFFSLAYEGEFTIGAGNYMSNEAIGKVGYFF